VIGMNDEQLAAAGQKTGDLADVADETVRDLVYATNADMFPGDVYRVLGNLHTLTGRLPQLLQQLETILARQLQDRELAVANGEHAGDPFAAITPAGDDLDQAAAAAEQLTRSLHAAQTATTYVSVTLP
jgi:hypothetical protein